MRAGELHLLAQLAELHKLDTEPGPFSLFAQDGMLTGVYGGKYTAGQRTVQYSNNQFAVSLPSEQFARLAKTFEEEVEVNIEITKSHKFRIIGGGHSLLLSRNSEEPLEFRWWEEQQGQASVKSGDLIEELQLARSFVSRTAHRPHLTGVRLQASGESLFLTAYDGMSGVLFSEIAAEVDAEFDATIKAEDLIAGLTILGDEVDLIFDKHLFASNTSAAFRCVPYIGDWPKFDSIQVEVERTPVILTKLAVDTLVEAAEALDAGTAIMLQSYEGRAQLRTIVSEHGAYAVTADTDYEGKERAFDLANLRQISKLGGTLEFGVPESPKAHYLVTSGARQYYFAGRVV